MKSTAKLHPLQQLILGLSEKEKSQLKKTIKAKTDREESLLLKLLDLMRGEDEYSTAQLLQKLKIKSKTQLSGVRSRLFSEILDIKVYEGRKENINFILHVTYEQVIILFQNKMFDAAEKLCRKAIGIARKHAKYQFLTELLHLQNNAIQYQDYKKYRAVNPALFGEIKSAIHHQLALARIRLLFEQIRVLGYRTWLPIEEKELVYIRNMDMELHEMITDQLFRNSVEEEALIRLFYLNTKALVSYLLHEKKEGAVACEEMLKSWKEEPHLIAGYTRLFLQSVNVTSYHDFFLNDIDLAEVHLNSYSVLANKYLDIPHYRTRFQVIYFNAALKIFHKTGQYDRVQDLLTRQGREILNLADKLSPDPDMLPLFTSVSISYFVLRQWDEAEAMIMEAKEKNHILQREDMMYFTLVFHLLILYEKKEWYRLDSAIDAAYHFLYSRKKMRIFEREMMLFLKRLSTSRDKIREQSICFQFLQRLQRINEKDIPLYSLYFNFPGWVESKIEGINYTEYVRRKLNIS